MKVALASLALLTGCASVAGQATVEEVCFQWGASLPTRSQADTEQTKAEIQEAYAVFALVCPEQEYLIP